MTDNELNDLDVRVAERLGFTFVRADNDTDMCVEDPDGNPATDCPQFSRDISAAWSLVNTLIAGGKTIEINHNGQSWWTSVGHADGVVEREGKTVAESICTAFLEATEERR